jgi:predicted SAM-dependent methyltransferase
MPLSLPTYTRIAWRKVAGHLRHLRKRKATLKWLDSHLPGRAVVQLEVGSGEKRGENGWLTLDTVEGCDLYWDLREGLPFPDNSIDTLYSSHFLEHLSFGEGETFLAEAVRALKPGGTFSISVPDAGIYLQAYARENSLENQGFFGHFPAYNHTTRIDYVNYVAYMDGHHKYMFDRDNLLHRLQACGLRDVRLRDFDPELDYAWRDFESIYAVAVK